MTVERQSSPYKSSIIFKGLTFSISRRIRDHKAVRESIIQRDGTIVGDERQATYVLIDVNQPANPDLPCIPIEWLWDCITAKELCDPTPYLPYVKFHAERPVGSLLTNTKSTKCPFTHGEVLALHRYVQAAVKKGAASKGNNVFRDLAKDHPRHTWQSWRSKYLSTDWSKLSGIVQDDQDIQLTKRDMEKESPREDAPKRSRVSGSHSGAVLVQAKQAITEANTRDEKSHRETRKSQRLSFYLSCAAAESQPTNLRSHIQSSLSAISNETPTSFKDTWLEGNPNAGRSYLPGSSQTINPLSERTVCDTTCQSPSRKDDERTFISTSPCVALKTRKQSRPVLVALEAAPASNVEHMSTSPTPTKPYRHHRSKSSRRLNRPSPTMSHEKGETGPGDLHGRVAASAVRFPLAEMDCTVSDWNGTKKSIDHASEAHLDDSHLSNELQPDLMTGHQACQVREEADTLSGCSEMRCEEERPGQRTPSTAQLQIGAIPPERFPLQERHLRERSRQQQAGAVLQNSQKHSSQNIPESQETLGWYGIDYQTVFTRILRQLVDIALDATCDDSLSATKLLKQLVDVYQRQRQAITPNTSKSASSHAGLELNETQLHELLPRNACGIWTPKDDRDLLSCTEDSISRAIEKHTRQGAQIRHDYLKGRLM